MMNRMIDWPALGSVFAPDGRGGGTALPASTKIDDVAAGDRFEMLMSLSLDDMLSPDEAVEFERMLADNPDMEQAWGEWQAFDFAFRSAQRIDPPRNFAASIEDRMLKRERRRRLWLGVGIGAIAVALWASLVLGLAGAGAYVMLGQSDWLATAVRVVVQSYATVQTQISAAANALATVLGTPQVQGMLFAYVLFAGLALWFWARFLQRSLDEERGVVSATS